MNISISLMRLLTTGNCSEGACILDDVDITASLYHAGAVDAYIDYCEYILKKFDEKLLLEGVISNPVNGLTSGQDARTTKTPEFTVVGASRSLAVLLQ